MDVVLEDLDMTTECNPAAGIWPTRCEDVIDNPAKEFALKELCLNTYRSVSYNPQVAAAARAAETACALGTGGYLPIRSRHGTRDGVNPVP